MKSRRETHGNKIVETLLQASALLDARSFGPEHIPRDFRLMFRLPSPDHPTLGEQLRQRTLKGVTGLSDSGQVLMLRMLGQNRNAMLIMPGKALVAKNNLSRVMYDNPEYLVSKDLAAIQRVYGDGTDRDHAINRVFQAMGEANIPETLQPLLQKYLDKYDEASFKKPINSVMDFARQWMGLNKPAALSSAREFFSDPGEFNEDPSTWDEWLQRRYASAMTIDGYVQALLAGLKVIGKTFVWEGEWVVKNKTLHIPDGSRLVLAAEEGPRLDKQRAFIAEHGLADVYPVTVAKADRLHHATIHLLNPSAARLTKQRMGST